MIEQLSESKAKGSESYSGELSEEMLQSPLTDPYRFDNRI